MSATPRRTARRRALAALAATATAASGVALLAPSTSVASSHREAPYTQGDPSIDNTDTYAFVSRDAPDSVNLIANWSPFQEPAGGPNFFPWDTQAAYDINIDNDGDAVADIVFRWTFNDVDNRGTAERGQTDGTFLYNDGKVTSLDDPDLKFRQTYDLTRSVDGGEFAVVLDNAKVVPNAVGVASVPNYAALRQAAITPVPGTKAKSYVGQADDSFFLDLRIFDLLYGGNLSQVGYDTLSGYNVNTIAYQVPKSDLAAAGNAKANPVVGVWSTTSRKQNRVLAATNAPAATSPTDSSDATTETGDFVQVSRLGAPLVNEAVVPANLKDFFNRTTPANDSAFLPKVQDPEIPILIEQLYRIPNPNKTASGAGRPDLVAAFLTGIDGLNTLALNDASPKPQAAEYLRLNMSTAPTAKPNPLGVIAGDKAGFPNGRRLVDDVVDIELQVLEGIINPDTPARVKAAVSGLGDGVRTNDKAFLSAFPYVADPHSGSQPRIGQNPVRFRQSFPSADRTVTAQVFGITPAIPGGRAVLIQTLPGGKQRVLANVPLNVAGTASYIRTVGRYPVGTSLSLRWQVIPPAFNAAGPNDGPMTTIRTR